MKTIAIQITNIREEDLLADKEALQSIGVDPICFGLIPFENEIIQAKDFERFDEVIPFGSVKIVRLWKAGHLPANAKIFYGCYDNFDQRFYSGKLRTLLLNFPAGYCRLGEIKERLFGGSAFVKPVNDLKAFAGIIVAEGERISDRLAAGTQDSSLTDNEPILVAPLRPIIREYRSFIVDGRVIDSCAYKFGGMVKWAAASQDEKAELLAYHEEVSEKYRPGRTYVMDTARLPSGELKVIEYNCLNCSGKYACDRAAIYRSVLAE